MIYLPDVYTLEMCPQLSPEGGVQPDSRILRHEALENSLLDNPSTPPKDRLRSLQLHMPELFRHVSPKGFKRLIDKVNAEWVTTG